MRFNPEIFRAYDVRGVYDKDLDCDFAVGLGTALVSYLKGPKILVAHDDRDSSIALAQSLMNGVMAGGSKVIYLGLATTPFFNFVFGQLGVAGGAMVTASHNPPQYAGFKIFGRGGNPLGLDSGLGIIKELVEKNQFDKFRKQGDLIKPDRKNLLEKYVKFVAAKAKSRPGELRDLKVKISGSGVAMEEAGLLAKICGLSVDDNGDIRFLFDGDADRLAVINENGDPVRSDHLVGLLAKDAVKFLSKPKVVYDSRFSKGVTQKFGEWGVKGFRSRVGRVFVRGEMIKRQADIGGELSGHVYFKEANYHELPLLAMLRLLKILARSKMSIVELVKPFQTWYNSGEINFEIADLPNRPDSGSEPPNRPLSFHYDRGKMIVWDLFELLKQKFSDGEFDDLDGLTIEYPDWWFNIRPSNTEPVLRLVVEAKSQELLEQKISEVSGLIKTALF